MLRQGPKHTFDESLALKDALRDLLDRSPQWPTRGAILPMARRSLGINPEHEEDWYRAAWWGYYAARLLRRYQRRNRMAELLSLVEPVDWAPLARALESGKGVILASAHLGPVRLPSFVIRETSYPVLELTANRRLVRSNPNALPAFSEADRKQSVVRALTHLRRNGVLATAPDGLHGNKLVVARFLNQRVRLFYGIGELARLSGAVTCWFSATWVGLDRVRVIIESIQTPKGEGDEWLRQWYQAYFDRLGRQLRSNPADLGFLSGGIWDTANGGLRWNYDELARTIARPVPSSSCGQCSTQGQVAPQEWNFDACPDGLAEGICK